MFLAAQKAKKKHLQSFGNGFQRTANAKRYGIGWTRSIREATGAGHGIPSRQGSREKRRAAGRVCLSLARRYNTLDLAGKVSVPRGCGPIGNPGEERRRRLGQRGDSCRRCLPRDHVLRRAMSKLCLEQEAMERGTFCESGITHYDTYCLPAESSKVPWARALRLWTPSRGAALCTPGRRCRPAPGTKTGSHAFTAWLPTLRGWCALVRSGA